MKRDEVVRKIIAVLLGVFGLWFIGAMVPSLFSTFAEGSFFSNIFFFFFCEIPFLVFGGYCLFVAYHVWSDISVKTVKRISLVAAIFVCTMIGGTIISMFEYEDSAYGNDIWMHLTVLFSVLVAGSFYLLLNKLLMRWLGFQEVIDWRRREKIVRRYFFFVAFWIWGLCMCVIDGLDTGSQWWFLVSLFVPIIIAFWVYKISVRIALRNKSTAVDGGVGKSVQGVVNNSTS